jgi:beta-glucosidase
MLLFVLAANAQTDSKMNSYIADLMKKMTLDEKIGQLNLLTAGAGIPTGAAVNTDVEQKIKDGKIGGLFGISGVDKIRRAQEIAVTSSRLKIPLLFGSDIIHGYRTTFPIPLALASSWDMTMIEKTARTASLEATADGLNWTFSPMVDIARDPRWGRVAEGSGEDPYLGSQIARAMVKGYQGTNLADKTTLMACVKHFALYGAADGGSRL